MISLDSLSTCQERQKVVPLAQPFCRDTSEVYSGFNESQQLIVALSRHKMTHQSLILALRPPRKKENMSLFCVSECSHARSE